jgi:hypothetical protein
MTDNNLSELPIKGHELLRDLLANPLSEETQKIRTGLLISATTVITIVMAGIIPTKVSPGGVELTNFQPRIFLLVLTCVIAYFLLCFTVNLLSDYARTRVFHERVNAHEEVIRKHLERLENELDGRERSLKTSWNEDFLDEKRVTYLKDVNPSFRKSMAEIDSLKIEIDAQKTVLASFSFRKRYSGVLGRIRILLDVIFPITLAVFAIVATVVKGLNLGVAIFFP